MTVAASLDKYGQLFNDDIEAAGLPATVTEASTALGAAGTNSVRVTVAVPTLDDWDTREAVHRQAIEFERSWNVHVVCAFRA